MNIAEAKKQIKNAMTAYFSKDRFGEYKIPVEKQRPIFLMGPPGIGKTAIMEQIAEELGVGLVSYSMTHHTRQSALGLPYIEKKNYGGKEYSVSEYTMSEIIASVYDMMEEPGVKEGILFLDEINCVSETLAPSMLQFLQYKIFGRHRVPDGWIVVTAGNPPEYNNSVREFDIVTRDRLKQIDIEPDYRAWKDYAVTAGVHAAVTTYLDIKNADFYRIETTVDGKSFVTARGWSDLSEMIKLCEENGLEVDEMLIGQYIRNRRVAKDFAIYYDLYNKYKSDYQADRILAGEFDDEIVNRAKDARFDERISLIGLLLDGCFSDLRETMCTEASLAELLNCLKQARVELIRGEKDSDEVIASYIEALKAKLAAGRKAGNISSDKQFALNGAISALSDERELLALKQPKNGQEAFMLLRDDHNSRVEALNKMADSAGTKLENLFKFAEIAFGDGQEMLVIVTELTVNRYGSAFISRFGCEKYYEHNKELLFYERQKEIKAELRDLGL